MYCDLRPDKNPQMDRSDEDNVILSIATRCAELPWDRNLGSTQKPYTKEIMRRWISQSDAETDLDKQIVACRSEERAEEQLQSLQETIRGDFQQLKDAIDTEMHDKSEIETRALKVRRSILALWTATAMDRSRPPSGASDDINRDK